MEPFLLEMQSIEKSFPGVQALRDVSLELRAGEVLALVGENGAGKSTLMKVLGGIVPPDGGTIRIGGRAVSIPDPAAARELGIRLIHQEVMLCPNLDVAGNIFLGEEVPSGFPLSVLPRKRMLSHSSRWTALVGLDVALGTPVKELSPGQMQMVEIAKALAGRARILVMDEPTSSLTLKEAERLFTIIGDLRRSGLGIIYISHRIEEIFRVSDRITVLRDGRRVGDLDTRASSHDAVLALMVGREIKSWFPVRRKAPGEVLLQVEGLRVTGAPGPVSFEGRRGEILGFAGLVGSGRTELMRALSGAEPALAGSIRLEGKPVSIRRPRDAIRRGIYLVPEDRKLHGLVLGMGTDHNLTLPGVARYHRFQLLRPRYERRVAEEQVRALEIKTPFLRQKVLHLSGGNQQKVVLGKWLALRPRVLLLDEPTRGIDVGARAEIHRLMAELADAGLLILMVSSELEEILGLSDRVAVMHGGRIAGFLSRGSMSEEAIMSLAVGRAPRETG